jgi:hypothetical protein
MLLEDDLDHAEKAGRPNTSNELTRKFDGLHFRNMHFIAEMKADTFASFQDDGKCDS